MLQLEGEKGRIINKVNKVYQDTVKIAGRVSNIMLLSTMLSITGCGNDNTGSDDSKVSAEKVVDIGSLSAEEELFLEELNNVKINFSLSLQNMKIPKSLSSEEQYQLFQKESSRKFNEVFKRFIDKYKLKGLLKFYYEENFCRFITYVEISRKSAPLEEFYLINSFANSYDIFKSSNNTCKKEPTIN